MKGFIEITIGEVGFDNGVPEEGVLGMSGEENLARKRWPVKSGVERDELGRDERVV